MENTEKLIEAMGMMAENMQRQALGQSMAYTEKDFLGLLKEHKEPVEEMPYFVDIMKQVNNLTIRKK